METKKIITAGVWNFIGTFLLRGIGVITIPIFTRILTVTEYGTFSLYLTYITITTIFIGLSLNSSLTNARFDFADHYKEFVSSILALSGFYAVVIIICANVLRQYIYYYCGIDVITLNIMLIFSFFQYVVFTFQKINTIEFNFRMTVSISIINSIGSIFLSILLIKLWNNHVLARLVGHSFIYIILGIIFFAYLLWKGKIFYKQIYWNYALRFAIPNIFQQLAHVVMSQFDRIAISYFNGQREVGLYSLTYNLGNILQTAWGAINEVWTPWLYRKLRNNEEDIVKQYSILYLYIFTLLSIVLVFVCPDVIYLMAPEEYWESRDLLYPILLAIYFIFLYSFPVNLEIYSKKNIFTAIGTIISAIINIVTNILFIPIFGYRAAAYTTLVSYIFLFVFHWIIMKYILNLHFYQLKYFIYSIAVVIVCSLLSFFFMNAPLYRYLCLIVLGVITYPINRKHALKFINVFKR